MKKLTTALTFVFVLLLLAAPIWAADAPDTKEPIKIGELFSYSSLPDEARGWQKGWKLAVEEINSSGGIRGRTLEVLSRDDKGSPPEAIKILEDYKNREGIKIIAGTVFSHVGLAASDFAKQNGLLLFRGYAGTSKLTAEAGHDRYFQIQPPSTVWSGVLADKAAQSGKNRWAFIATDYELNRTLIDKFQKELKRQNPQVEFVETQWHPLGKLDAGPVIRAVANAHPDGIFVASLPPDYAKLVREGRKRGLFENRVIISPFAGNASYIRPLGKEAPVGWFSCKGYSLDKLSGRDQQKFVSTFEKAYGEKPILESFYGYSVIKILAEAIGAVGADNPDNVAKYIKSNLFNLPGYQISFRADGTSNLGDWAGYTGFENGAPTILNPTYFPPDKYLPSTEENMAKWTK